ncbi:MAG: VWA domain-containing protein [Pseudomonas sp.]|nr:VWA domain-containing protein [Pseudomonas sp.]
MAKSLIGSLPIYTQHLAEQTGVQVLVQGKQAKTDGKTVVVPFTEDDLQLSFGFVAHETSHVRNTNMEVFQGTVPTPFRMNLLNILEDIRIERLSMDQYPGTEEDIRYMNRKVLLDAFKVEHVAQAQPIHIIHNAILFGGYWKLQEPQLEAPAKAYLAAFEALLGQELADKIMAQVENTLKCNSTQEVLQLVDAIIALLPSNEDQPQQPNPEPDQGEEKGDKGEQSQAGDDDQDDDGDTSDSGDDQSSGSNEGDEEGDQPTDGQDDADSSDDADDGQGGSGDGDESDDDGQPDSKQKSSSGSTGDSQGDQDSNSNADASGGGQADTKDAQGNPSSQGAGQAGDQQGNAPQNLREQALNATADDLKGLISEVGDAAAELLGQKAQKEVHPAAPFILAGRAVRRSGEASQRREMLGAEHSAGLRQILNGLLQAQVDCRVQLKRQGKRIDTSRIAMMKGGETRVFRNKARAERQSAAIQFLFDKSGSMTDAMEQAEAALFAVLRSLEGLPLVTTGAVSFPGSNSSAEGCCDLIKRSNERLGAAVQAGGFGALASGGTPMARAIWPAVVEVLRAKGERKVLFVITDGEPTGGSESHCKELFERCAASGIEVVGLGFGQANEYTLKRIFKKYVAVGSVGNLKAALFGVVREALTN